MPFAQGHFSVANSSHFRSTIGRLRNVTVHFDHIAELQISRDNWFSSTIFETKRVKDFLKDKLILARKLSLLTTSLIIGRGLTLTLQFTDTSDVQEWGSTAIAEGGSGTVFGVRFGSDKGGGNNFNNHTIDTHNQTVTFKDDTSICRLLGIKVTRLDTGVKLNSIVSTGRPLSEVPLHRQVAKELIANGKIPDRIAVLAALK